MERFRKRWRERWRGRWRGKRLKEKKDGVERSRARMKLLMGYGVCERKKEP